ncbi:MAG: MFS transporter [Patescibacteria group bacterium]
MKMFYHLLVNTALSSVTNFTVWFAITFYVFLETQSVFATGMIAGIYLVLTAASGFWFGSLVDHYPKKLVMLGSSIVSLLAYIAGFVVYIQAAPGAFSDVSSVLLWTFIPILILGVIAGNIRTIALPTLITVLIPEERRDKANGLAGMVSGIAFGTVSVISGLLVGYSGMYHVLILAAVLTLATIVHLLFLAFPEPVPDATKEEESKRVDIRGTLVLLATIPGMIALILFTTFNNFLGGVFMSLLDAYALSMVSVQLWGFVLGALSFSFMLGGFLIAKLGLGKNPLRTLLLANVVIWVVSCLFPLYSSIIFVAIGMFFYMITFPFIEAAEHTVIQKVVPPERQGRVFGFAQSVEQLASPLTAFIMAPIAQFVFIPFMTTGAGVALIGDWFGTGPDRGIALVFIMTGIIGLIATLFALRSKQYRDLSKQYLKGVPASAPA